MKRLVGALLGAMMVTSLSAQDAVDFAGERITLYAPGAAGSGNDIYARTLQPFLAKHLPGNPTILVRNLPGAGTIAGMNTFQQQGKPDGLHFVSVSTSGVTNFALKEPSVQYDLPSWIPVIVSPQGIVVYVDPKLNVTGPQDATKLQGQKLTYGGNGPTGADLRVIIMFDLLGWDVNNVWGLSRGPARQGYERGEFNVNFDSTSGYNEAGIELVKGGTAVPMFTGGLIDESGNVVRDPNYPDIPTFLEVYQTVHGKPLSGVEYDVWFTLQQMSAMTSKYLALPAGTPPEIVMTYVNAVEAMLADPEAQEITKAAFEGYPQFVGEAGTPIVQAATTIKPEVWKWLDGWLQEHEGIALGAGG